MFCRWWQLLVDSAMSRKKSHVAWIVKKHVAVEVQVVPEMVSELEYGAIIW